MTTLWWRRLRGYAAALAIVGVFTGGVALVRAAGDVANASMLYLLGVLLVAVLFGSWPAILASVASFVAFNFFFVEPRYTVTVADSEEWIALGLLLVSGVITGQLAALLRERARESERREKEAVVLYDVVRLMAEPDLQCALTGVAERLRTELGLSAVMIALGGDAAVVDDSPNAQRVIRRAWRLANRLGAPLTAAFVETPGWAGAGPEERMGLDANLRLAEDLGADIVRVQGSDPAAALLQVARDKNAKSIVIGPHRKRGVTGILRPSTAAKLERAEEADVYVVATRGDD